MSATPKEWDTIRSTCGRGRVTYHATWSESRPWQTTDNGTAYGSFHTLRQAVESLQSRGYTFDRTY